MRLTQNQHKHRDNQLGRFVDQQGGEDFLAVVNGQIPYHDYIAITYVAAGNGVGEIETVTFKVGGSSGVTQATLTLTYNADNKLETVTKT